MTRAPYIPTETFDGERSDLTPAMARDELSESYQHIYSTEARHVHQALANNIYLIYIFRSYSVTLWSESGVSPREREFAIFAVANEAGSRYEWHQHVRHALMPGLEESEIQAIGSGDTAPFEGKEAAIVSYARAAVARQVDNALHEALGEYVSDESVVGIGTLAAAYIGLAHLLDALAVTPEEPFVGWELEDL